MLDSMGTLYMCTSGGLDWFIIFKLVGTPESGPFLQLMMVGFMFLNTFALMNILGGVFLEKALSNSQPDREAMALKKRRRDREDIEALRLLFDELDYESDGFLSQEELFGNLQREEVRAYLAALDVEVRDIKMFYDILATDGIDGELINASDFIELCTRMRGAASSIDLAGVSFQLKALRREVQEFNHAFDNIAVEGATELNGTVKFTAGDPDVRAHSKHLLKQLPNKHCEARGFDAPTPKVSDSHPEELWSPPPASEAMRPSTAPNVRSSKTNPS